MITATEFEIDGYGFKLKPLPVLESIDCLPKVLEVFPALKMAATGETEIVKLMGARRTFAQLRALIEAFVGSCQARHAPEAPHYSDMRPLLGTIFARKHTLLLQWALRVIEQEYGDFLSEAFPSPEPSESASDSDSPTKPAA